MVMAPSIANWQLRIMHQLDASEHTAGRANRLQAKHWPGHTLDRTVVLFDDVVKLFKALLH